MSEERSGTTAPIASRYGLVRPLQGRYVAGVCAGLGRATGTDPVLWRVVLAVLICFGGIGAAVYLALWVLTPEEGDTASPVEALLGRGQSGTSPALAVILSVVAVVMLIFILPRPLYLVLLGAAVVLTVLLLTNRGGGPAAAAAPVGASTATRPPAEGASPPAPAPSAGRTTASGEAPPTDETAPSGGEAPAGQQAHAAAAGSAQPAATVPTGYHPPVAPTLAGPDRSGYQPPFAPHGPFAGPPPPPPVPTTTRERSALPAVTFFAALAVLGGLGMLDLTGALDVPAAGYVAAALAVVGGGLLAGAWLGRPRGLIAVGVVLALVLPIAHAVGTWEHPEDVGDITWVPQSREDLEDEYAVRFGSGLLDLRQVDLAGEPVEIAVDVAFGDLRVIVPEDVPVEADVSTRFGAATVFGTTLAGVTQQVVEDGGDPDQGTLRLELSSRFANVEVHR